MKKDGPGLLHNRAAAIFHAGEDAVRGLQESLGHRFADLSLLACALTHPSFPSRANNQRLEFLGDAVLQLCVSELLYGGGNDKEGRLTFKRQRLVCEEALADVARGIGLGPCLLMEDSFRAQGGDAQDSVLADAMEAVLAAVYLDGELLSAREAVRKLWGDRISSAEPNLDPKGALQAWAAGKGLPEPEYRLTGEEGPPHARTFSITLCLDGREISRGQGKSKKLAQQDAARAALKTLEEAQGKG